jgi:hypothetical protein
MSFPPLLFCAAGFADLFSVEDDGEALNTELLHVLCCFVPPASLVCSV